MTQQEVQTQFETWLTMFKSNMTLDYFKRNYASDYRDLYNAFYAGYTANLLKGVNSGQETSPVAKASTAFSRACRRVFSAVS